jgi:hypothetical protein
MNKRQAFFVFVSLAIVLASITIPLWWDWAQPYISGIIQYVRIKINQILHLL